MLALMPLLRYSYSVRINLHLSFQVSGILAPKPVSSFAHFGFDDKLMKVIRKQGYEHPTSIQAQVYSFD